MAAWQQAFQSRAERVIGTGRAVLALVGWLAIWLDPSQPAQRADVTYFLMTVYVLYALGAAAAAWREDAGKRIWGVLTHVVDLAFFSILMYLTEGPTSPFFVFFTFALLAATLRWQWRGTLWTAAAAMVVLLLLGGTAGPTLAGEDFELNRVIIRMVYLTVAAGLLSYVGLYQERVRRELWTLSTGPRALTQSPEQPISDVVAYVAQVFGADRVLMAWFEEEEPWLHLALREEGRFTRTREAPSTYDPLVAEPLAGTGFLCADAADRSGTVLCGRDGGVEPWTGAPVHPALRERFRIAQALALPLQGDSIEGRLFVLDKPGLTADDLLIGEVVAGQVATRMDLFALALKLRQAAVAEERVRVARDLHDGVLQALTGTALQLQTLQAALPRDLEAVRRRVAAMQEAIITEQRELRRFIQQLKPGVASPGGAPLVLADELAEVAARIKRQWDLDLASTVEPVDAGLPAPLSGEISRIVAEGVANARRHGRASRVEIRVRVGNGKVGISISDNGAGFPFQGRLAHGELAARGLGPVSLRERVAALGGELAVVSSPSGARLEIVLPVAELAHAH